jgi:arsenate reductase
MKKNVLFLCTGNSCRSQMAEAIVNARLGDTWQAWSAGTKPTGCVHPKTIAVLAERGIAHVGTSKQIEALRTIPFDLVVTVCDASAETCPIWLGKEKHIHHSFPDPAMSDDLDDFRKVLDDIAHNIPSLLKGHAEAL